MSADTENDYFSDGIAEEIINTLTKIEGLKVTARTSSFTFKGRQLSVQEIGKKLGVAAILEGSIRIAGNKVRIAVQIVNTADGFHFWSASYDRSMDDIFAVQDEISRKVADQLRENLGHFDINEDPSPPQQIPLASYKLYLKARFLVRRLNIPDTKVAISILNKAIEDASDFTLAYLELHAAYSFLGSMGTTPQQEAFAVGTQYLNRAIELDEELPECLYQRAQYHLWQKWELDQALQLLSSAIQKRPSFADAYQAMALILILQRNFEAALYYQERAMKLNPFDANVHYQKGAICYYQRQYQEAVIQFRKSIEIDPDYLFSHVMISASFLLQNKQEEALLWAQKSPRSSDADLSRTFITAIVYAQQKEQKKLEDTVRQFESLLNTELHGRALLLLIYLYAAGSKFDQALTLTQEAIKLRLPMVLLLGHDPLLEMLHAESSFQLMMSQVLGESVPYEIPGSKYGKSLFKEGEAKKYQLQLEQIMAEAKPYLDPQLSLRDLAQMLPLHPNYLSQLLNQSFNKNFSEFINTYRLEAFKEKAADPALSHYTILALAYESGFNSKSTFNTFFKKTLGMSPSQYWKQVK